MGLDKEQAKILSEVNYYMQQAILRVGEYHVAFSTNDALIYANQVTTKPTFYYSCIYYNENGRRVEIPLKNIEALFDLGYFEGNHPIRNNGELNLYAWLTTKGWYAYRLLITKGASSYRPEADSAMQRFALIFDE